MRISEFGSRIKKKTPFALHSAPRNRHSAIVVLLLLFLAGCQKEGGTVFSIAVHPTRPDVLYLSSGKGLFKTTDAGKNWSRVEGGLGPFQILSIAVNPAMPSLIYVGTFSDGVYRSSDGGRSWMLINAGMREYVSVVNAVVIDPQNPQTLYAGTTMGAYKSLDNGMMWDRISVGLDSLFVVCMAVDPRNPMRIYAGTSGGVYRSVDGGKRWATVNSGMIEKTREHAMALGVNALAFDPATPGRLFAATAQGLYESRDGGEGWKRQAIAEPFVLSVALGRGVPAPVYAGTNHGLYLSSNDGADWKKVHDQEVRTIAVDPSRPEVAYIGTGDGIFKTESGGNQWTRLAAPQ